MSPAVNLSLPLLLFRLLCLTRHASRLCRFQEMLGVMRAAMPRTHIVVQGLYPRGADFDANKYVWPNNYTFALSLLNTHYEVTSVLADTVKGFFLRGSHSTDICDNRCRK